MMVSLSLRQLRTLLCSVILVAIPILLSAATFTAVISGDWSNPITWGGLAPGASITDADEIIIGANVAVTLDADVEINNPLAVLTTLGNLNSTTTKLTLTAGTMAGIGDVTLHEMRIGASGLVVATGNLTFDKLETASTALALNAHVHVKQTFACTAGILSLLNTATFQLDSAATVTMAGGTFLPGTATIQAGGVINLVYQGPSQTTGAETSLGVISDLTVNLSDSARTLFLASDLHISDTLHLASGYLAIKNHNLTLQGALLTAVGASITGSDSSGLFLNGSDSIALVFTPNASMLDSFTVHLSNGNVTLNADLAVKSLLELQQGSLLLNGYNLTLGGEMTAITGTVTGHPASGVFLNGTGDVALTFAYDGAQLDSFVVNHTSGFVTLQSDLTVDSIAHLQNGTFWLNGNDFTINGQLIFSGSANLAGNPASGLFLNGEGDIDLKMSAIGASLQTLVANQTNGNITLRSNLIVSDSLALEQGTLDLNGFDLTVGGDFPIAAGASIKGHAASDLTLSGAGNVTLVFSPNSSVLNALSVNKTNGAVTLTSDLSVSGVVALTAGALVLEVYDLTVHGNLTTTSGASIAGGTQAGLLIDGTGNATVAFSPGAALLDTFVVSQANGSVKLLSDLTVESLVDLQQGALTLSGNDLTSHGALRTALGAWITGNATSGLYLDGTGDVSLVFSQNGALLDVLQISQAGGKVTLTSDLTVSDSLDMQDGTLLLNGHNLTVTGGVGTAPGAFLTGSATSGLLLDGTGNVSLVFSPGGALLNTFFVSQSNGQVQLNSDLTVQGSVELQQGALSLNGFDLLVTGTMVTSPGASIVGSPTSGLWLDGTGNVSLSFTLNQSTLDTLVVSQTGGNVILNSDLTVGRNLQLQQGQLVLNGNDLTIDGTLNTLAGATIKGSATSGLTLDGVGNVSLFFSAVGAILNTLITSQQNGSVILHSDLTVKGNVKLEEGALALNGNTLILNGSMTTVSGATITGGVSSGLTLDGTGDVTLTFSPNSALLDDLIVSQTGGNVILNSDLQVGTLVSLVEGALVLNGNDLTVLATLSSAAGATITGHNASSLVLNGLGDASLFFTPNSAVLYGLVVSQTNGNVILQSDLKVVNSVDLQEGSLVLNDHHVTLNGWLVTVPGASISGSANAGLTLDGTGQVSLVFAPNTALLDTLVVSQSNGNVTLTSDLTVGANVDLQQGALVLNGFDLTVTGKLTTGPSASITGSIYSGLFLQGTGDVLLVFSQNGNMLDTLLVGQTGGNVTLNTHLSILSNLQLQKGLLVLGNNHLTMPVFSSLTGGSPDSYVVTNGTGYFSAFVEAGGLSVLFPCGSLDGYFPASLQQGGTADDVQLEVRVDGGVLSEGVTGTDLTSTQKLVDHTWFVNAADAGAQLDLRFKLGWNPAAEVNGFNRNNCYISHYTNGQWDGSSPAPAQGTNGYFTTVRNHITSLSPFRVADATILDVKNIQVQGCKLFPNLVSGDIPVLVQFEALTAGIAQVQVLNNLGQVVRTITANITSGTNEITLPVDGLPSGTYWIDVQTAGQQRLMQPLVKV